MKINCESTAAVPIINVPAKKVSPQGTPLTREVTGSPLIRYSMVYTHTNWSLRKSPPFKMPSRPYFVRNIYFLQNMAPMALSLAIWPLAMIHTKI